MHYFYKTWCVEVGEEMFILIFFIYYARIVKIAVKKQVFLCFALCWTCFHFYIISYYYYYFDWHQTWLRSVCLRFYKCTHGWLELTGNELMMQDAALAKCFRCEYYMQHFSGVWPFGWSDVFIARVGRGTSQQKRIGSALPCLLGCLHRNLRVFACVCVGKENDASVCLCSCEKKKAQSLWQP